MTNWHTPTSKAARNRKRYEDVLELLDANIDVLTTMNVQHLESVAPSVQRISGITVRETVPDWVMKRVREVVMADLTPEALQTRMRRGDIYPLDRVEKALSNFFRPGNLIALRELALQEVAQEVDRSLESYLEQEGGERILGIRERFAVAISSNPAAQHLIAPRGPHGQAARRGVVRGLRGHWSGRQRRQPALLWRQTCGLPKPWARRSSN